MSSGFDTIIREILIKIFECFLYEDEVRMACLQLSIIFGLSKLVVLKLNNSRSAQCDVACGVFFNIYIEDNLRKLSN